MKRFFRIKYLIILAIVAAAVWFFFFKGKGEEDNKGPAPVETIQVERGSVELFLKETGDIQPKNTLAVRSKLSGKIKTLYVEDGEPVREGQRLATVEPNVQEALTLIQRKTSVVQLREDFEQKERELNRLNKLSDKGFVAEQDLEKAKLDFDTAKSRYGLERISYQALENEYGLPSEWTTAVEAGSSALPDYQVLSPITGVITSLIIKEGELVTSGTSGLGREGSEIMWIADMSEMIVQCLISEVDISKIAINQIADISLTSDAETLIPAYVSFVAVAGVKTDRNLVNFKVEFHFKDNDPKTLRPGMTCNVNIHAAKRSDVLRIPVLAFGDKDGETHVKIKKGETFEPVPVELGLRSDAWAEVISGISEGDTLAADYSDFDGEAYGGRKWRRMR